jgi:hypothetical protein
MNLASYILLAAILLAFSISLYKSIKSKGACSDCKCSCPAKRASNK